MTIEKLNLVLMRIKEFALEHHLKKLSILWHGGEPLLMGEKFFYQIEKILNKEFENIQLRHLFQTNLTILADTDIPSLYKLIKQDGGISTSFDLIENVRNLKNNESYSKKWIIAYNKLKKKNIPVNVVYAIHKKSITKVEEIYLFFRNIGVKSIRFNPVIKPQSNDSDTVFNKYDESSLFITNEDYSKFLKQLWDIWLKYRKDMIIEPLESWYKLHFQGNARLSCSFNGMCSQNIFSIDPDGTVYQCGRYMDYGLESFGNLSMLSFDQMYKKRGLNNRIEILKDSQCKDCQWWNYCHGGCPTEAYAFYGDTNRKTFWCQAYKDFFNIVFNESINTNSQKGNS